MDDNTSKVHMRSGLRNLALLDAGPLAGMVAPQPTPLRNSVSATTAALAMDRGPTEKPGKKIHDPLAEAPKPLTAEPSAALLKRSKSGRSDGEEMVDPLAEDGMDRDEGIEAEPGRVYVCHKWTANSQDWLGRMLGDLDAAGVPYMQSDMASECCTRPIMLYYLH